MSVWDSLVAAFKSGAWKSWLATLLTAAVSFGVLDSNQVDLINNVVAGVVTVLSMAAALVHTFHAAALKRQNAVLAGGRG